MARLGLHPQGGIAPTDRRHSFGQRCQRVYFIVKFMLTAESESPMN